MKLVVIRSYRLIAQIPTNLERKLTQEIIGAEMPSVIETVSCMRDRARLRSTKGKGAGAWLNVIPSSSKLTTVSHDFCLAACLRLGLSMPFNGCVYQCDHSSYLAGSRYHLMTCNGVGSSLDS